MACGLLLSRPSAAAAQTITSNQTTPVVSTGANIYVEPGVTLSGSTGIVNGTATQTISNLGIISSTSYGVSDSISIGTLSNSGTISAGNTGVANSGSISVLVNSGLLSSTDTALGNFGTIDTLINNGTVTGSSGIYNGGTIGTLTNTGAIVGQFDGLYNQDSVDVLDNSSTISGNSDGIYNAGFRFEDKDEVSFAGIHSDLASTNFLSGASIGTLTNNGMISGGSFGIYNGGGSENLLTIVPGVIVDSAAPSFGSGSSANASGGFIGLLTNQGVISGGDAGIFNGGAIDTLINFETITGGDTGILNNNASFASAFARSAAAFSSSASFATASIATLTNSGLITGGFTGIGNSSVIGTLSNSGTISGGDTGILNNNASFISTFERSAAAFSSSASFATAGIATLTNSGLITGGVAGIDNYSFIDTLSNSGTISGGSTGIYNSGSIEALSNTGLITGADFGIYDAGTPGTLINGGTISGATGVELTGSGSTLVNTGTIASTDGGDAILFGGVNDLVLGTGSQIIGSIDGGGSASQISLQGTGSLNNDIVNFGSGSALGISPGADWTGTGRWTIATVNNNGTFQPGVAGTPLSLTGNYVQGQGGTLRVVVTPTQTSQMLITGTASLAGKIIYNLAPGTYLPHTYVVLSASNGIVGTFSSASYNGLPSGLTATTTYVADPTVDLVLSGAGTVVSPTPPPPVVIAPLNDTIFSAQTQALAVESQNATADLLGKATLGGTAASAACAAEAPLSPATTSPGQADQSARLTRAVASAFCGAGGWIEATGSLGHVDGSSGAPAYNANTAGFTAGIDKVLNQTGTRLGIAVGYDHTFLHDKAGGSGSMGTTRVALYGAQPFGQATLAAVAGYAHAGDSTSRASGIGDLSENNGVNIFSGGVQASTHLALRSIDIVPAAGIRVASVEGTNFAESASGLARAFALSGRTAHYTSVQPYVLAQASESFITASQTVITPDAELGYQYEADSRGAATDIIAADGTGFRTPHNRLDRSAALVALGISAGRNNWSLFANYTGYLAGNWTDQIGQVGLRVTF